MELFKKIMGLMLAVCIMSGVWIITSKFIGFEHALFIALATMYINPIKNNK